jgi:NAD+ synthase (glutamine-hydrolysing)
MLATRAADASCDLLYVNAVGGQDELVFDGASLAVDASGTIVARARQFEEQVMVVDLDVRPVFRKRLLDPRGRATAPPLEEILITASSRADDPPCPPECAEPLPAVREVYEALVLGTRDYVRKNGFSDVVIGLSGGIDSSLVAAIAVDALGADHVHGVLMPSRYSSSGSRTDAQKLVESLGIESRIIEIEPIHAAVLGQLEPSFEGCEEDLTEENVQARVRGLLLMALSNKFGWLVLATGNKSEMAAGFSTLYGDLAGGYAVIKDVPKTLVYALARELPCIPEEVLTKPPSAELRPDQRDDQSLPAYDQLDPILEAYVEGDSTAADLVRAGFDNDLVRRVVDMVDKAEYKRRQAPPGVRVTAKAFGKDRRLPITNRYRG